MLQLDDITVAYGGATVVHSVSMQVPDTTVTAIIGPNGAGKSTLFRAISRLIKYQGTIRYNGESLDDKRPRDVVRMGIIQCPQSGQLFPELSVAENLALGGYGKARATVKRKVDESLDLFPALKPRLKQLAGTLSGGERQMVAIGRSLVGEPKLLLLDEPTLGLSPALRDTVEESIAHIATDLKLAVALVEQDAAFALDLAQNVYVLSSGEIVAQGTVDEIKSDSNIEKIYLGVM